MQKDICLDGIWDFGFQEGATLEDLNLKKISFDTVMPVPGCFDAQNRYFARHGCGVYRRSLRCSGGTVKLTIESLGLRGKVFWDEKCVGMCEHPFIREKLFFHAGKAGDHILTIVTENMEHPMKKGTMFFEDYDFYGYGGIYDSVVLTELPEFYIERIQVTPRDLSGRIEVKLVTAGKLPSRCKARIVVDGAYRCTQTLSGSVSIFQTTVPNPTLWTLEKPNLHTIEIELMKRSSVMDVQRAAFGIRTITANKGRLLLNGKKIFLVGYNRHESHPEFGYATTTALMAADLSMIKEQGCNFIRGSHYPQKEKFLELCDRMGILVWEEVPGWQNKSPQFENPDFCRLQNETAAAMVRKSANHPSVILWGFLNEVFMDVSPRKLIASLVDTIRKEDDSRLTTFAFATAWIDRGDDCLDLVDVLGFNTYPGWYDGGVTPRNLENIPATLLRLSRWASQKRLRDKPLIASEIGASAICGDHSGFRWSEEYQADVLATALRHFYSHSRWSGVAFWMFSDTKSYIRLPKFTARPRGFNNKGVTDEYRRPKYAWHRITELLKSFQNKGK